MDRLPVSCSYWQQIRCIWSVSGGRRTLVTMCGKLPQWAA